MSRDQDNSKGRRNRRQEPQQRRGHMADYNKQDFSAPRPPRREYSPDPVTGQPIENILIAINHRDGKGPINFDTALEQIRGSEHLGPNEFVCYIGAGNFAVYAEVETNGKKSLELKKKIPYEDHHEKPSWRKELSPGISRDYKPEPTLLSELYSPEEVSQFPRMGSGSGIYLPRNS